MFMLPTVYGCAIRSGTSSSVPVSCPGAHRDLRKRERFARRREEELRGWLADTSADVLCLQEVRAEPQQLPEHVRTPDGWRHARPRRRQGAAPASPSTPAASPTESRSVSARRSSTPAAGTSRADLPGVTVASYPPPGEVGTERQDEKVRFMGEFLAYLKELRERAAADGREVVVCGDWNIAHREADLKNWRANKKNSGFPCRRSASGWDASWIRRRGGYVDVVRALHPDVEGPYSWWSLPRAGLRPRFRMAHRLPRRHPGAGREGGQGSRRAGRHARRALVRPRAGDGRLRPLDPRQSSPPSLPCFRIRRSSARESSASMTLRARGAGGGVPPRGRGAVSGWRRGRPGRRRVRGTRRRPGGLRPGGCPRGPGRRRPPAGGG